MTIEKALEIDDRFNADGIVDVIDFREYRETARMALQKQNPKPVRVEKYPYKQKMYYCPVCGQKQMGTRHNFENGCYCKQCGQALMWEG